MATKLEKNVREIIAHHGGTYVGFVDRLASGF